MKINSFASSQDGTNGTKKIINNCYLQFNFIKFRFNRFNIVNITTVRITLCRADRYSRCISLVRSPREMGRDKLKNVHEERIQIIRYYYREHLEELIGMILHKRDKGKPIVSAHVKPFYSFPVSTIRVFWKVNLRELFLDCWDFIDEIKRK